MQRIFPPKSNSISDIAGWNYLRNASFLVAFIGAIYLLIPQRHMVMGHWQYLFRGIWSIKSYIICPWFVLLGFMAAHRLKPSRRLRCYVGAIALTITIAKTALMLHDSLCSRSFYIPYNGIQPWLPLLLTLFAFALAPSRFKLRRITEVGIYLLIFVLSSLLYFSTTYLEFGCTTMMLRENTIHQLGLEFIINCTQVICAFCIVELAMSRIAYRAVASGVVKMVVILVALYPWLMLSINEFGRIINLSSWSKPMLLINPLTLAIVVYVPKIVKALSDKKGLLNKKQIQVD